MDYENNDAPSCKLNQIENVKRCNKCYKIPLIKPIIRNYKYYIECICENGHIDEINLEDYLYNNNNSINKIDCFECKKKQENDFLNFYYCISCEQILCNNCIINHRNDFHQVIFLSKYDSTCLEHNLSFTHYCKDCKKNICLLCSEIHQGHQKIFLSNNLFPNQKIEEIINKGNNDILKFKKIKDELIEGLEKQIKKIKAIYSKYETNMNLLYSLFNNLINTYNIEEQLNNYNYEIIENLKIIEKIKFPFNEPFPCFSGCNNIYEKSEIFISYYEQKFKFTKNDIFKILNYHSDIINQIILLKDGRIASCSNDKSIIIYNKEDFNVQLKIEFKDENNNSNEKDNNCILNIMQANNDYIFASFYSGNISIIKLTSLTSYQIIQNINAHKEIVRKIIELKDGRFVSCSQDKTIKIWKFINDELIIDKIINVDYSISSIEEVNENEIISTPVLENGSIIFWDINECKITHKIDGFACVHCWNILKKISNNTFIVGGARNIYLIKDYKLIDNINYINTSLKEIYSVCYLNNGNILTGHYNGFIKQWELKDDKLKYIGEKKIHDNRIRVISQINNLILSGSNDKIIKVFKIQSILN